jgi:hypothetical protein
MFAPINRPRPQRVHAPLSKVEARFRAPAGCPASTPAKQQPPSCDLLSGLDLLPPPRRWARRGR